MPHGVTYRAVWKGLQDVTLVRPQDAIFTLSKDVVSGLPLVLRRGPYGDVHRTSFGDVLRTFSGHKFAER